MANIRACISKTVLSAIILMALVAAVRVHAAVVTNANDFVTKLQTSQAANHEVLFTTSTGVSESNTITLTFDSGFNTSSMTEDDVDVADDGTELTTAPTCAGTEKASVAIASNVMTITICAGDGGAIAPGSVVRIRIGTNATNSGIGTNQIVNPSTVANHFITIGGTFGDFGSIVLPIKLSADAITVSGIISSSGGATTTVTSCDNCDTQTQTDKTPPIISGIVVSGVTKNQATISWTTDENANSKILYGKTSNFEIGFVIDTSLVKTHAFVLSGLDEGQTYYFAIKSADQSNNIATSNTATFNTLDLTAPVISNISVTNITKNSATISWSTNEMATGVLDYGLTVGYGSNKTNTTPSLGHSFDLTSLQSSQTYHFRLRSQDGSLNTTSSDDQIFVTLANLPPANVAGFMITPGDKALTLKWTNPVEDDFAGVRILRCPTTFPTSPTDTSCVSVLENSTLETLTQTGLVNGTTYYYGVFAKDTSSQFASGALASGKPSAPEKEVPKDVCGDKICSATESVSSCPVDCTVQQPKSETVCGDSICASTETSTSCPADCPVQTEQQKGSVCGNGVCDSGETTFTCAEDCKLPGKPTTAGSAEVGSLKQSDVKMNVASGSIVLSSTNATTDVLPRTPLHVSVPTATLGTGVDRVTILVGSDTYIMRPVTEVGLLSPSTMNAKVATSTDANVLFYEADVLTPVTTSLNPMTIFVEYINGQSFTVSSFLRVVAPGATREIIDGEEAGIGQVGLKLYQVVGSENIVWDGSPYGQMNPTTSAEDGSFGWYVPNGLYYVHAEHDKYAIVDTPVFTVSNNIANPRVLMTPLVKKEEVPVETVSVTVLPQVAVQEAVKQITASIQKIVESKTVKVVTESLETVRANPVVQQAADVSVPTLVVSTGTSVVVMSVAFDFLPFIQYLFTAPILFFGRRKRKAFGVIYNAISKEAIGLAVVRLYQVKDELERPGKLVRSRVTDKGGRFYFLVQPGLYRLTVTKAGFQFPSQHLQTKKEDVQYIDLYHGELLKVTEKDAVITPNIPIDPSSASEYHEPKSILWRARLRVFQHIIAMSGVIISLVFALIRPNVLAAAMVIIQLGVYILVRRLAKPHKPKSWGIVYDEKTGRPLANVVARIFEPKYNKLLETQVTDNKGRYSFLLGPAEYYAVFEREGYRPLQIRPIDFTKDQESKDFSVNIKLLEKGT